MERDMVKEKQRKDFVASLLKKNSSKGELSSSLSKKNSFEYNVLSPAMPLPVHTAQESSSTLDYCDRLRYTEKVNKKEEKIKSDKGKFCYIRTDRNDKTKGGFKKNPPYQCYEEEKEESFKKDPSGLTSYTPRKFINASSQGWNYLKEKNLGYLQFLTKNSPFKLPFQLSYNASKFLTNFNRARHGLVNQRTSHFPKAPKTLKEDECDEMVNDLNSNNRSDEFQHSTWLSLDGQILNMQSAVDHPGISKNLDAETKLAWEAFTPLQRIVTVAASTAAIASGKDEMRNEVLRLKRAVEAREHTLKLMRVELRNKQKKEAMDSDNEKETECSPEAENQENDVNKNNEIVGEEKEEKLQENGINSVFNNSFRLSFLNECSQPFSNSNSNSNSHSNSNPFSTFNSNSNSDSVSSLFSKANYIEKGKMKVDDYYSQNQNNNHYHSYNHNYNYNYNEEEENLTHLQSKLKSNFKSKSKVKSKSKSKSPLKNDACNMNGMDNTTQFNSMKEIHDGIHENNYSKESYHSKNQKSFDFDCDSDFDLNSIQALKKSKVFFDPSIKEFIEEDISPIENTSNPNSFESENDIFFNLNNNESISNVQRDVSVLISSLSLIIQKLNELENAEEDYSKQCSKNNYSSSYDNSKAITDLFKTLEQASAWLSRLENSISNSNSFYNHFKFKSSNLLNYKTKMEMMTLDCDTNSDFKNFKNIETNIYESENEKYNEKGFDFVESNLKTPYFESLNIKDGVKQRLETQTEEKEKEKEREKRERSKERENDTGKVNPFNKLFSINPFIKKEKEVKNLIEEEFKTKIKTVLKEKEREREKQKERGRERVKSANYNTEEEEGEEEGEGEDPLKQSQNKFQFVSKKSQNVSEVNSNQIKFDSTCIANWKKKSHELESENESQAATCHEDDEEDKSSDRSQMEFKSIMPTNHIHPFYFSDSETDGRDAYKWMDESDAARWQQEMGEMEEMHACLKTATSSIFKMMWGRDGGFKGLIERLMEGEGKKERKSEYLHLMHTIASQVSKVDSFSKRLKIFIQEFQQRHSNLLNESFTLKEILKEKEGRLEEIMNASRMIDESHQQKLDELQIKCNGKSKRIKEMKKEMKSLSLKIEEQNNEILILKKELIEKEGKKKDGHGGNGGNEEDIVWRVGLPLLECDLSLYSNDENEYDNGDEYSQNYAYVDDDVKILNINEHSINSMQYEHGRGGRKGRKGIECGREGEESEKEGIGKGRMVTWRESMHGLKEEMREREVKREEGGLRDRERERQGKGDIGKEGKGEGNVNKTKFRESIHSNHLSSNARISPSSYSLVPKPSSSSSSSSSSSFSSSSSSFSSQHINRLFESNGNASSKKTAFNSANSEKVSKFIRKPLFPNQAFSHGGKEDVAANNEVYRVSHLLKENFFPTKVSSS